MLRPLTGSKHLRHLHKRGLRSIMTHALFKGMSRSIILSNELSFVYIERQLPVFCLLVRLSRSCCKTEMESL